MIRELPLRTDGPSLIRDKLKFSKNEEKIMNLVVVLNRNKMKSLTKHTNIHTFSR